MKKYISTFFAVFLDIAALFGFWYLFNDKQNALIATLSVALISAIVVIIIAFCDLTKSEKRIKKLNIKINEIQENRKSLSKQYSEKKRKIDIYEKYWAFLSIVFINAIQDSKEERFEQAYKLYNMFTEHIEKEK